MLSDNSSLTTELLHRIAELEKQVEQLESRNQFLEEQFRIAQHKQFGKSLEGHPGQGELFNEVEELYVEIEAPEQETISAINPSANHCPQTYHAKWWCMISATKKKSVIAVQVNYTASAKINQRSFSLSRLRLK